MAMRNYLRVWVVIGLFLIVSACSEKPLSSPIQANIVTSSKNSDIEGYTRATPGRGLSFPQDEGPHPDYQTEWWYYTGNLISTDGQRFGYQLTFFRRALLPLAEIKQRSSDLATTQAYLAHFAISDVARQQHQAFDRFSRGAAGLAGAQASPFKVWVYNWNVDESGPRATSLYAAQGSYELSLHLLDRKGPVLNGNNGYSQKGPEPGNASYYYSLTHLNTDGTLRIDNQLFKVTGTSWMDHEFSTSALSQGQIGWDWFSVQLADQRELMFYQIRRDDHTLDPHSSGTVISADGSYHHIPQSDFKIIVTGTWKSPHTHAIYPAHWIVEIPSEGLILEISPQISDQEINLSYTYWEGAVKIVGKDGAKPIAGFGYVELTGYAGSIAGQF